MFLEHYAKTFGFRESDLGYVKAFYSPFNTFGPLLKLEELTFRVRVCRSDDHKVLPVDGDDLLILLEGPEGCVQNDSRLVASVTIDGRYEGWSSVFESVVLRLMAIAAVSAQERKVDLLTLG